MTNAGIKAVLKNKNPSTRWLRFYLNVYLYIVILFAAIATPSIVIGLLSSANWIAEGNILELIKFLVRTLTAAASIVTFLEMRDLSMPGYKWNVVMLCSGFVWTVLIYVSEWLNADADYRTQMSGVALFLALLLFLWLIPNLVYFKNRKHLFRSYTAAEVAAAIKGEPPTPALPIRKPCQYKPTKAKVHTHKRTYGRKTRPASLMTEKN